MRRLLKCAISVARSALSVTASMRANDRGERREAPFLEPRLVHEAVVEIANLLRLRPRRRVRRSSDVLDDPSELFLGVIAELVERAVARLVGRQLECIEPLAIDRTVEIVLRPRAGIDVLQIDAGHRQGGRSGGRFGTGGFGQNHTSGKMCKPDDGKQRSGHGLFLRLAIMGARCRRSRRRGRIIAYDRAAFVDSPSDGAAVVDGVVARLCTSVFEPPQCGSWGDTDASARRSAFSNSMTVLEKGRGPLRVVRAHPLAGAERRLHDPQRPLTPRWLQHEFSGRSVESLQCRRPAEAV